MKELLKKLDIDKSMPYDMRMVEAHLHLNHNVKTADSVFEALCYIFDDNAPPIAAVLQGYVDKLPESVHMLEGIRDGLLYRDMCLTCVKQKLIGFEGLG
jgi:hypothetical protein